VVGKRGNGKKVKREVDFTDLNNAYPKDSYPLPNIDSLVDSASGCGLLSFVDAFSGYNQIRMHPRDEEKIAFMAEATNYCYKVMPSVLKNARAIYQCLMDTILQPMMVRNVQVYFSDIVVTFETSETHVTDLEESFKTIGKYSLNLNPKKCVFGVQARKFLEFLLIDRKIKPNPDKCALILDMRSPNNVKEVQRLTGQMATLSRFLSANGDKGIVIFSASERMIISFGWSSAMRPS